MRITLDVEAVVLEAARKEARRTGRAENDMLNDALRQHFTVMPSQDVKISEEEINAVLAGMHEIMKDAPVLSADAFSRQSFYDEE